MVTTGTLSSSPPHRRCVINPASPVHPRLPPRRPLSRRMVVVPTRHQGACNSRAHRRDLDTRTSFRRKQRRDRLLPLRSHSPHPRESNRLSLLDQLLRNARAILRHTSVEPHLAAAPTALQRPRDRFAPGAFRLPGSPRPSWGGELDVYAAPPTQPRLRSRSDPTAETPAMCLTQ